MADFLDDAMVRPLYTSEMVDLDFNDDTRVTPLSAQAPGRGSAGRMYSPGVGRQTPDAGRTDGFGVVFGPENNVQSTLRFPSLSERDDQSYQADMLVRRQLDVMKRRMDMSADPSQSSLTLDDMNHLKDGYRGLKASGWDPGRAASAATQTYHAFGTYSDLENRAGWLDDMARQRGTDISDVSRRIRIHRDAFKQQYMTDLGYVNGITPSAVSVASADDEFADAFRSLKAVEDKYGVIFDDSVYGDVMKYVSRASASLTGNGASASDIGMDRVVDAALHASGALSGGEYSNPVTELLIAQNADRRGISWSSYDTFPEDPSGAPSGDSANGVTYGRQPTVAGQMNEQDFSMSRGIREALSKHYVRNIKEGRAATDFSDTDVLRQDLVNSFKMNSMSLDGLSDDDFGQLADRIISQRADGKAIRLTDTVKDMLYAPDPQSLLPPEIRELSRTVTGKWEDGFHALVSDFESPQASPASVAESIGKFERVVRSSGMSAAAQDAIVGMTSSFMNGKAKSEMWNPGAIAQQAAESPGRTRPQVVRHELTKIAQATQLVSMIDACRQGGVITEREAADLVGGFYDSRTGEINLGVLHTVDAGVGHDSSRDTMENWLLKTERPFKAASVSSTRVRPVNEDPLERTFRTLDARLSASNIQGLGDIRGVVSKTVGIMDQLRAAYDRIPKDGDGVLKGGAIVEDSTTAGLRRPNDSTVGAWLVGQKDEQNEFRKAMNRIGLAMSDLKASGMFVPGLEEGGYNGSLSSMRFAGHWDDAASASIRDGKSVGSGRELLYGVSPEKASAWASWTRNQTMDTPAAKAQVDSVAQSLFLECMRGFPGVSPKDPRAQAAMAQIRRLVRNNFIAGTAVGGMDDLVGEAEGLQTSVNGTGGSVGWSKFDNDQAVADRIRSVTTPLVRQSQEAYQVELQRRAMQAAAVKQARDDVDR